MPGDAEEGTEVFQRKSRKISVEKCLAAWAWTTALTQTNAPWEASVDSRVIANSLRSTLILNSSC